MTMSEAQAVARLRESGGASFFEEDIISLVGREMYSHLVEMGILLVEEVRYRSFDGTDEPVVLCRLWGGM